ncbi:MAG: PP2C family protein-serine/threonine phosphatase [Candidatus Eisenbacteria bacterium]
METLNGNLLMQTEGRDRVWRGLIIGVFVLVLAYSGVFLAREYTKVATFIGMGDIWSFVALGGQGPATFIEVSADDFVGPPYPAPGDTLLEVNALPATARNYFNTFNTETPAGKVIPIRFRSRGVDRENQVVTRTIPGLLRFQVVSLFVLRTLLTLALILVGFWAFIRRPLSPPVRALALFSFATAVGMLQQRVVIAEDYASFQIPCAGFLGASFAALAFFAPVFYLKLLLVFPATNAFYGAHRKAVNALLFVPGSVLFALALAGRTNIAGPAAVHGTIFLLLGSFLLIRSHVQADSFVAKRQTRLVLIGSIPGLLLYGLLQWIVFLAPDWLASRSAVAQLWFFNATFLLLLLIPLSFAYAFGRYRLLEVEGKVRRGTRLVAINVVFLAAVFAVLYLFGELLLKQLSVESRTPTLVVGLILAMGFIPAQRKVRRVLENRFYPERARLRALLRDFLQTAERRTTDADVFWEELSHRLSLGLSAREVRPILRKGTPEPPSNGNVSNSFEMLDDLVGRLGTGDSPLLVDELIESGRVPVSEGQRRCLSEEQSAVLVPLLVQSERIGFLLLGRKTNGEDYSPEELELLRSLAAQIALVAENLDLFEEKLERQKLEEQLGVARRIQEGLLPRILPATPGLRLAARIRFCLNVAGDYYDILPLQDGRTLLAIGDVAGKGIGAALLMSNLQASLRTVKDLGISLADAVRRINALIHENTPPDLFITLFVAIVDPESGEVVYVNAGHNLPLLVRSDGGVERLGIGGIPLGVFPDAEYEEGQTVLRRGEMLLLFTDGVSEAMRPTDEEFGEERLTSLATAYASRGPQEIVERIEREVEAFTGLTSFGDDFTLLAAVPV